VRQHNFVHRIPEIAAAQVLTLLRQGNLAEAAYLAETHKLPLSQARVHLAQGDPSAALTILEPLRQQMEAKSWQDELLKVMVLEARSLQANGEKYSFQSACRSAVCSDKLRGYAGATDGRIRYAHGHGSGIGGRHRLERWAH
jgi:hypothetical protein